MSLSDEQLKILRDRLTRTEGKRNRPDVDTVGKLTIGIGHNLIDKGLSDEIIDILFIEDIRQAEIDVEKIPVYHQIDPIRQTVLLDMVFNMGINKVLEFQRTLGYLARGDYDGAADEMLLSKWAKEVGQRAVELAQIIRTGTIQGVNS